MATATKVIQIALREVGYKEKPGNDTKFGLWYGLNNQPWCYIFISWVFFHAGLNIAKCASCPVGHAWYKKKGRLFLKPQPGDIAFFSWNPENIPQHVGIVERVNPDGSFVTIEGNTSSGLKGSQDNGDGVYRRARKVSDTVGFGRPLYEG
jgi:hypothetical protein